MRDSVREWMESGDGFTWNSLMVQGYSIIQVGKRKIRSDKFRKKCDVDYDSSEMVEVLKNKGKIYAYKSNKRIKALYKVERDGSTLICNDCRYSDDIKDESVIDLLDEQVMLLISSNAEYKTDGKAVFQGVELPKLKRTYGKFNIWMMLAYTALMMPCFSISLGLPVGLCIAIPFGVSMGIATRPVTFTYEEKQAE